MKQRFILSWVFGDICGLETFSFLLSNNEKLQIWNLENSFAFRALSEERERELVRGLVYCAKPMQQRPLCLSIQKKSFVLNRNANAKTRKAKRDKRHLELERER